jgi:hypothetical protein
MFEKSQVKHNNLDYHNFFIKCAPFLLKIEKDFNINDKKGKKI